MSDLISRQAAIEALDAICDRECEYTKKQRAIMCAACHLGSAFDAIDELPSAEVEPVKRGKWIYDNQFHWYRASCSECGYKRVTDIKAEKWNGWKYCPNCGAKMGAEEG